MRVLEVYPDVERPAMLVESGDAIVWMRAEMDHVGYAYFRWRLEHTRLVVMALLGLVRKGLLTPWS